MRLIVASFSEHNRADTARRSLLRSWPAARVALVRRTDGTELQLTVADQFEGPALYRLYRRGASLMADLTI